MEYYEDNTYEINQEEISEESEINLTEDEIYQLKKDEKYEFTTKLYNFFENYVLHYNNLNDICINEQNMNYLDFRKWVDKYLI